MIKIENIMSIYAGLLFIFIPFKSLSSELKSSLSSGLKKDKTMFAKMRRVPKELETIM